MRVAVMTMAYNERVNLPIWIRHYTNHCPDATLFVIDHGSEDGTTRNLSGVNVIPLPRTPFDDQTRADFVADLQHALLRFYDVVVYTDCDEMLVADPAKHASLSSFLAVTQDDVIAPTGLNVHHLRGVEGPIDLSAPILGQRRFVRFASGACKPSIARVPLRWVPGFHWCDRIATYRSDLYQFHLRRMDIGVSLARLQLTREMPWSERALQHNWARRQRQSDEERIREEFEAPDEQMSAHGPAPFVFDADIKRLVDSLRSHEGFQVGEFFRGPIVEVPDGLHGLI